MKNALNITLLGLPRAPEGDGNYKEQGKVDPLPMAMVFENECGAEMPREKEHSIPLGNKIAKSSQFGRRANCGELEEEAARVKSSSRWRG